MSVARKPDRAELQAQGTVCQVGRAVSQGVWRLQTLTDVCGASSQGAQEFPPLRSLSPSNFPDLFVFALGLWID